MRPMLAGRYDPANVRYPVIVQPKLDGIRVIVHGGVAYSRSMKTIPNRFIQNFCASHADVLELVDGELIVGPATAANCYRVTDSGVMSRDSEPDFALVAFDLISETIPYYLRRHQVSLIAEGLSDSRLVLVGQLYCWDESHLLRAEERYVSQGYEGIILRDPNSLYKQGRSTTREGALIKLKRFEDAEAVVVGFEELLSNQNPQTQSNIGLTERSGHRANMIPMDTLGALLVRNVADGVEFKIGSFLGLDLPARREIWEHQESYLGRPLTYKYQKVGGYDRPRMPIFLRWRSDLPRAVSAC